MSVSIASDKSDIDENMFAEERKNKILEMISKEKKVTVSDLAKLFGVTGATIRTYLRDLENARLLTRTHGGAIERTRTGFEQDSHEKEVQNLDAKQKIGRAALELVDDDDTIVLDTGTTTLELARCLSTRRNITVVTNDIVIAQLLEETGIAGIIFMGGLVRRGFHCTVGIQGRTLTEGLTADKAFMGANGFTMAKGATTPDVQQAETKKHMIAISAKTILLCDHTKIGKVSFAQFASSEQIDALVTDQIESKDRDLIERAGIELVVAS
jgi:DeoR family transcriptional regulator, fructose operon transcriptional repressor